MCGIGLNLQSLTCLGANVPPFCMVNLPLAKGMTGVSTSRPHLLPITFLATIMTTVLFVIQTHMLALRSDHAEYTQ